LLAHREFDLPDERQIARFDARSRASHAPWSDVEVILVILRHDAEIEDEYAGSRGEKRRA
jgi:hypothetical protein